MKHPFSLEKLFSFLNSQSIVLSGQQQDQLRIYQNLLTTWSGKQNLVSKSDVFHLAERHFLPSALLSLYMPELIGGKVIDIGTGSGFPGVVLQILRPELSISLLDSSRKKVLFLEEVCDQLNLNCPIICQRAEEYIVGDDEKYDFVVSRAVARLDLLWDLSRHLIKSGGCLFAFKGGNYQDEIDGLDQNILTVEVIAPEKEWIETSNYLMHKYIIKLET